VTLLRESRSVDSSYTHRPKCARPAPSIVLGDTVLKWYDVAPAEDPVPDELRALARRDLADGVRLGEVRLGEELGFVILHRCGGGFHFLLLQTWRNDNELWETVWAKDGESDPAFHPWPIEGTHRPTFCVWELGAVAHEREAWCRYLASARDEESRRTYLRDVFEGPV
jgi:hypothetical protein